MFRVSESSNFQVRHLRNADQNLSEFRFNAVIRSKITFPSVFGGIGEAFGSFCAPNVNILGSESDMKHMSGFYAENEQPEVSQPQGDPHYNKRGAGVMACTKHTFSTKSVLSPAREAKVTFFDFDLSL